MRAPRKKTQLENARCIPLDFTRQCTFRPSGFATGSRVYPYRWVFTHAPSLGRNLWWEHTQIARQKTGAGVNCVGTRSTNLHATNAAIRTHGVPSGLSVRHSPIMVFQRIAPRFADPLFTNFPHTIARQDADRRQVFAPLRKFTVKFPPCRERAKGKEAQNKIGRGKRRQMTVHTRMAELQTQLKKNNVPWK